MGGGWGDKPRAIASARIPKILVLNGRTLLPQAGALARASGAIRARLRDPQFENLLFVFFRDETRKLEQRPVPAPLSSVLGSWVGVRRPFPTCLIPNRAPLGFNPKILVLAFGASVTLRTLKWYGAV